MSLYSNPITRLEIKKAAHFDDPDPTEDSFLAYISFSLSLILRTGRDWGPACVPTRAWIKPGTRVGDLAQRVRPSSLHLSELFQKKSGTELGNSKYLLYKHNSFQSIHLQLCNEHLHSVTFQLSANRNGCCYIQIIAFIFDKGCFELIIDDM